MRKNYRILSLDQEEFAIARRLWFHVLHEAYSQENGFYNRHHASLSSAIDSGIVKANKEEATLIYRYQSYLFSTMSHLFKLRVIMELERLNVNLLSGDRLVEKVTSILHQHGAELGLSNSKLSNEIINNADVDRVKDQSEQYRQVVINKILEIARQQRLQMTRVDVPRDVYFGDKKMSTSDEFRQALGNSGVSRDLMAYLEEFTSQKLLCVSRNFFDDFLHSIQLKMKLAHRNNISQRTVFNVNPDFSVSVTIRRPGVDLLKIDGIISAQEEARNKLKEHGPLKLDCVIRLKIQLGPENDMLSTKNNPHQGVVVEIEHAYLDIMDEDVWQRYLSQHLKSIYLKIISGQSLLNLDWDIFCKLSYEYEAIDSKYELVKKLSGTNVKRMILLSWYSSEFAKLIFNNGQLMQRICSAPFISVMLKAIKNRHHELVWLNSRLTLILDSLEKIENEQWWELSKDLNIRSMREPVLAAVSSLCVNGSVNAEEKQHRMEKISKASKSAIFMASIGPTLVESFYEANRQFAAERVEGSSWYSVTKLWFSYQYMSYFSDEYLDGSPELFKNTNFTESESDRLSIREMIIQHGLFEKLFTRSSGIASWFGLQSNVVDLLSAEDIADVLLAVPDCSKDLIWGIINRDKAIVAKLMTLKEPSAEGNGGAVDKLAKVLLYFHPEMGQNGDILGEEKVIDLLENIIIMPQISQETRLSYWMSELKSIELRAAKTTILDIRSIPNKQANDDSLRQAIKNILVRDDLSEFLFLVEAMKVEPTSDQAIKTHVISRLGPALAAEKLAGIVRRAYSEENHLLYQACVKTIGQDPLAYIYVITHLVESVNNDVLMDLFSFSEIFNCAMSSEIFCQSIANKDLPDLKKSIWNLTMAYLEKDELKNEQCFTVDKQSLEKMKQMLSIVGINSRDMFAEETLHKFWEYILRSPNNIFGEKSLFAYMVSALGGSKSTDTLENIEKSEVVQYMLKHIKPAQMRRLWFMVAKKMADKSRVVSKTFEFLNFLIRPVSRGESVFKKKLLDGVTGVELTAMMKVFFVAIDSHNSNLSEEKTFRPWSLRSKFQIFLQSLFSEQDLVAETLARMACVFHKEKTLLSANLFRGEDFWFSAVCDESHIRWQASLSSSDKIVEEIVESALLMKSFKEIQFLLKQRLKEYPKALVVLFKNPKFIEKLLCYIREESHKAQVAVSVIKIISELDGHEQLISSFANCLLFDAMVNDGLASRILQNPVCCQFVASYADVYIMLNFLSNTATHSVKIKLSNVSEFLDRIKMLPSNESRAIFSEYSMLLSYKVLAFETWYFRCLAQAKPIYQQGDQLLSRELEEWQKTMMHYLANHYFDYEDYLDLLLKEYRGEFTIEHDSQILRDLFIQDSMFCYHVLNEGASQHQVVDLVTAEHNLMQLATENLPENLLGECVAGADVEQIKRDFISIDPLVIENIYIESMLLRYLLNGPMLSFIMESLAAERILDFSNSYPHIGIEIIYSYLRNPEFRLQMISKQPGLIYSLFSALIDSGLTEHRLLAIEMLEVDHDFADNLIRNAEHATTIIGNATHLEVVRLLMLDNAYISSEILQNIQKTFDELFQSKINPTQKIQFFLKLLLLYDDPPDYFRPHYQGLQKWLYRFLQEPRHLDFLVDAYPRLLVKVYLAACAGSDRVNLALRSLLCCDRHRQLLRRVLLIGNANDINVLLCGFEFPTCNPVLSQLRRIIDSKNSQLGFSIEASSYFRKLDDADLIRYIVSHSSVTAVNDLLKGGLSEQVTRMFATYPEALKRVFDSATSLELLSSIFKVLDEVIPYYFSVAEVGAFHLRTYLHQLYVEKLFANESVRPPRDIIVYLLNTFKIDKENRFVDVKTSIKQEVPELYLVAMLFVNHPALQLNSIKYFILSTVDSTSGRLIGSGLFPTQYYQSLIDAANGEPDNIDASLQAELKDISYQAYKSELHL